MVKKVVKPVEGVDETPVKKVSKKAAPAVAEKKTRAPAEANPNETTLSELCEELGIEPRLARQKLRKAEGVEKGEGGRWAWRNGSKELGNIRKILTPKE